jgi:hypothetical protein
MRHAIAAAHIEIAPERRNSLSNSVHRRAPAKAPQYWPISHELPDERSGIVVQFSNAP